MIKKLLLSVCCLIGCTKEQKASLSEEIRYTQQTHPRTEIREISNFVVSIRNCPEFLDDLDHVKYCFKMACFNASFENTDLKIENMTEYLERYEIRGEKGYAALYVDKKISSCILEFFCFDETYDYEEFIVAFMVPFNFVVMLEDADFSSPEK